MLAVCLCRGGVLTFLTLIGAWRSRHVKDLGLGGAELLQVGLPGCAVRHKCKKGNRLFLVVLLVIPGADSKLWVCKQ